MGEGPHCDSATLHFFPSFAFSAGSGLPHILPHRLTQFRVSFGFPIRDSKISVNLASGER